jgi:hypothetical protein
MFEEDLEEIEPVVSLTSLLEQDKVILNPTLPSCSSIEWSEGVDKEKLKNMILFVGLYGLFLLCGIFFPKVSDILF